MIKIQCPCCRHIWYEQSLEAILERISLQWKYWEPYMTKEQKQKVIEFNNPFRLKQTLKEKGVLKMLCIRCRLDLTIKAHSMSSLAKNNAAIKA